MHEISQYSRIIFGKLPIILNLALLRSFLAPLNCVTPFTLIFRSTFCLATRRCEVSVFSREMPGVRDPKLKLEISKAFKLHGYQLRVEASRHLEDLLAPVTLRSPWLEKILDVLAKKDLETNVVDKAIIDKVIKVVKA